MGVETMHALEKFLMLWQETHSYEIVLCSNHHRMGKLQFWSTNAFEFESQNGVKSTDLMCVSWHLAVQFLIGLVTCGLKTLCTIGTRNCVDLAIGFVTCCWAFDFDFKFEIHIKSPLRSSQQSHWNLCKSPLIDTTSHTKMES